jgi:hypothetical protein
MRSSWICNICNKSYRGENAYYCAICDFDCCKKCFEMVLNYKYPDDELIDYAHHPHKVVISESRSDFNCQECKKINKGYCYLCKQCKTKICLNCRFKN